MYMESEIYVQILLLILFIGTSTSDFHICNYPFVFDASAKTTLLQTDQYFQMHNAQYAAMSDASNIFQLFMQQQQGEESAQEYISHLVCSVRRNNLGKMIIS